MSCFLDTTPFGSLLTAVAKEKLPPEVLSQTLLSPVTALETAQHRGKLQLLREYREHLKPMVSRFIRNPESFDDFKKMLLMHPSTYFGGLLDAFHAQCVMNSDFMQFHLSRYGGNPPQGIAGSQRFKSDVRDSMQLILSQEVPFITCDGDLIKKSSSLLRVQVIPTDNDLNCIVGAMSLANAGGLTADKI